MAFYTVVQEDSAQVKRKNIRQEDNSRGDASEKRVHVDD